MDWNQILSLFVPAGVSPLSYLIALAITFGVVLALGLVGRYVFGEHSTLHSSVSSTLGIVFIYALVVLIHTTGIQLGFVVSPLPFIQISGDQLTFFNWFAWDFVEICGEVLNMVILAFVVNLIDRWMVVGKTFWTWLLFRILSVILGVVLYSVVMGLLGQYLPEGLLTWAPVILLGLLVLSLMVGALKFIVGALLLTVNPLIALLYTFFFATLVGKMISKAMLTTLMIGAMVFGINYLGIQSIPIGWNGLTTYIPLMIVLALLWYLIGKVMVAAGKPVKSDKKKVEK